MLSFLTSNLLFSEGSSLVLFLFFLCAVSWSIYRPLCLVVFLFFLFSLYFFRNPKRVCTKALYDQSCIISPADGRVVAVLYDQKQGNEGFAYKISIFLSPLDVHVNWMPTAGKVERIAYRPGTFSLAFLPKSSDFNERNDLHIVTKAGYKLIVRQIAGAVARRICCWVSEGDMLPLGHKYGMIRFGSRVDILLPKNVRIDVGVGQRVYGGQTIVGKWL